MYGSNQYNILDMQKSNLISEYRTEGKHTD